MVSIRPRVVLDTNVLVSAIVFGGKPDKLLHLVIDKQLIGVTSPDLLTELTGVLRKKFNFSEKQLEFIDRKIKQSFLVVKPSQTITLLEDDTDNRVLEAAKEGATEYIVTGDNHLLRIKKYRSIPIVTPHYFVDEVLKK